MKKTSMRKRNNKIIMEVRKKKSRRTISKCTHLKMHKSYNLRKFKS